MLGTETKIFNCSIGLPVINTPFTVVYWPSANKKPKNHSELTPTSLAG